MWLLMWQCNENSHMPYAWILSPYRVHLPLYNCMDPLTLWNTSATVQLHVVGDDSPLPPSVQLENAKQLLAVSKKKVVFATDDLTSPLGQLDRGVLIIT